MSDRIAITKSHIPAYTEVNLSARHRPFLLHDDKVLDLAKMPQRRNFNRLLNWYVPTDVLALLLGFVCAWGLAEIINSAFFARSLEMSRVSQFTSLRLAQFIVITTGVVLWFQHTDHYRIRMPFWLECEKIMGTLGFAMMADGFWQFVGKQDFSRLWLTSSWVIAAVFIIALRSMLRAYLRRAGRFQVRTLLVGAGKTAAHTRDALMSDPGFGYEITAQIKDVSAVAGKSWEALYVAYGVDHIILALDGQDLAAAERSLAQLARESVPFSVVPPLNTLPVHGMVSQYFFNHDIMLMTRNSGLEQPLHCFLKRLLDMLVSASALLALSPIMLVIALLIRRDGGAAFYGHTRIGRNGRAFACLKFRSMVMGGDAVLARYLAEHPCARSEWEATRKLQNDPRVTKLGSFLRRSSLDELPQLINVLRGEMSLVGPRPIVTAEVNNYDGDIAHYYRVRPGITGLWQVSGRSDVSYPQRVHMDSWYVRNWSLWHDIAILCKTIPALLKRKGAY
jgi:Undecaprenyl-phosphate galactose phosphotransferase WbaP